jgi:hypothetical protein
VPGDSGVFPAAGVAGWISELVPGTVAASSETDTAESETGGGGSRPNPLSAYSYPKTIAAERIKKTTRRFSMWRIYFRYLK